MQPTRNWTECRKRGKKVGRSGSCGGEEKKDYGDAKTSSLVCDGHRAEAQTRTRRKRLLKDTDGTRRRNPRKWNKKSNARCLLKFNLFPTHTTEIKPGGVLRTKQAKSMGKDKKDQEKKRN